MKLFNTLSQEIQVLSKKDHSFYAYSCGVTVYDHCHLGHGRMFVVQDLLYRTLENLGYRPCFLRNITDVDDKILNKAAQLKQSPAQIAQEYTTSMQADVLALGCHRPDAEPKATEHIGKMIEMIQSLVDQGYAYVTQGEVLFSVSSFANYGKLSGQDLNALQAGARVEIDTRKKHPFDFTLWKTITDGSQSWESPWGPGRPGWHIECSAMIASLVPGILDLHMGGMDLKFPHHENEIAQSECCFHQPLAQHWMHVGFVTVEGEKMAKSLGNFTYLHEALNSLGPQVVRYLYLMTHYRQPLPWSAERCQQATQNFYGLVDMIEHLAGSDGVDSLKTQQSNEALWRRLMAPLEEDLNSPLALTIAHQELQLLKKLPSPQRTQSLATIVQWFEHILGLHLLKECRPLMSIDKIEHSQLHTFGQQRAQAKQLKNYSLADELRQKIESLGFEVVDTPAETLYRLQRKIWLN